MTTIIPIIVLGTLTLVLATMIVFAYKKLYVIEDPRIDQVEDMLPHANCGACGYPGCRPFAEALVSGKALPGKCTVSNDAGRMAIANYLGVDVGKEEKIVARLACAGGFNVALNKSHYKGIQSCQGASLISGGGKACSWGCLGYGDCEKVCDFDAITMDAFSIPQVNVDTCTACGDCVEICPKDLFSLHPISHQLWVACKSLAMGDDVLDVCDVGCTGCGKCAMDAKDNLISMVNNLPMIDYTKLHQTQVPIQRCPTGAIVWIDNTLGPLKGPESKKIIKKTHKNIGYS